MSRASILALAAAGAAVLSCGGATSSGPDRAPPGDDVPSPPRTYACTGAVPWNATPCPGADQDLTSDTPRVVTGPSGTCTAARCSYVCDARAVFEDGACVIEPPPPPAARFTDHGDGTVTDEVTGLTWLADPGCADTVGGVARPGGALSWWDANGWVAGLAAGACGLGDGSVAGDWRIPVADDLMTLADDLGRAASDPFPDRQRSAYYWTSSAPCSTAVWAVDVDARAIDQYAKDSVLPVWPVR